MHHRMTDCALHMAALFAAAAVLPQPLHLPRSEWYDDYDEMCAEADRKGIPRPLGRPIAMKFQRISRTAHW
jgi:hypothetical protein